jgi:adenosylcobinamide-GDP ribazoletransferase
MLISRIPLGFLGVKPETCRRAVIHFPIAGYAAFLVWYAAFKIFSLVLPDRVIPVCLSLMAVYYLFNLFHFDGFLDSIDGLLSQKPKDEILRIMKIGNIGPSALFFGVIYLILKVYLASNIGVFALLPVFLISRWGMSFAASISMPAVESGLGSMVSFGKPLYLALSTLYILPLLMYGKAYIKGIMLITVIILVFIITKAIEKKIGGLTGDNFGLINEMNELILMLICFGAKQ